MSLFDLVLTIGGSMAFCALAFMQHRRHPETKTWLLPLIAGMIFVGLTIYNIFFKQ